MFGIFEKIFGSEEGQAGRGRAGKAGEGDVKQAIIVREDLKMGKGKIAGQVGHAAVLGYRRVRREFPEIAEKWEGEGEKKVVLKVGSEKEFFSLYEKVKKDLPCALVRDAGKTQIEAGTATCFSIGPYYSGEIDRFTRELKLL